MDRESDLLTDLNQPIDGIVHALIVCLAERSETLFEQRLALAFVPRARNVAVPIIPQLLSTIASPWGIGAMIPRVCAAAAR